MLLFPGITHPHYIACPNNNNTHLPHYIAFPSNNNTHPPPLCWLFFTRCLLCCKVDNETSQEKANYWWCYREHVCHHLNSQLFEERPLLFTQNMQIFKWHVERGWQSKTYTQMCKTNTDIIKPYTVNLDCHLVFSSNWLHQQSYCRGAGTRSSDFSETAALIQAKFYRKVPIGHVSRSSFFKMFILKMFVNFFRFR